jgi:hypothetical protein
MGDLLAQAQLDGFDARHFRDLVARRAADQERRYSLAGDVEAARANRQVWSDLVRFSQRPLEWLRSFTRRA